MNKRILSAFFDELEKLSYTLPMGSTFGKNVGRSWGMGSAKGGFATKMRSAGMQNQPKMQKKIPKMPGTINPMRAKTPNLKPPATAERNNQVKLRRDLSNVTLSNTRS